MSSSAPPVPKSAFSVCAAAPAGTNWFWPPSASPRLPRNWTLSAMISTACRFVPSWASHSRHSRRPSTATGRPLERYCAQLSPWLPQTVMSKYFGFSVHSPVAPSFRRVFTASRRLQTAVPLGVWRSSGSLVRLPTSTTRLMLAMFLAPSESGGPRLLRGPVVVIGARGHGRDRCGRLRLASLDAGDGEVAYDAVGDLQDAGDPRQRRRRDREDQHVAGALRLVADLVGELAPAPRLMVVPRAAVTLDPLAHARHDLCHTVVGELGVQQQQNLVLVHAPECSFPWTEDGPAPWAPLRVRRRDGRGEKKRQCSIASWPG